jgi:hypothetical protein
MDILKTKKLRDLQGSLACKKFVMTIFEFIGKFYFKFLEVFSELGIRIWKFPGFSYFIVLRQIREVKKITNTVLKTTLKTE